MPPFALAPYTSTLASDMKYVVLILVVLLLVLHQDDWFFDIWRSPDLVFGFMPKTLLYHAGISLAAGVTWYLATVVAWPKELERAPVESTTKEQQS